MAVEIPLAADFLAMLDPSGDAVGTAEQARRMFDVTRFQCLAHSRAGDALTLPVDGMHRLDAEAVLAAGFLQHGEIAAPALAETKVVADDKVADRQSTHQNVLYKAFRAECRQSGIEATDIDPVDAAAFQQIELFAQTGQPCRRFVGRKILPRVRLESQHCRRQGHVARLSRQPVEQRPVAAMQTIEIADGQYRGRGRLLRDSAKYQHCRCVLPKKGELYQSSPLALAWTRITAEAFLVGKCQPGFGEWRILGEILLDAPQDGLGHLVR